LSTRHVAGAPEQFNLPIRNTVTSSVSYVTGSHAYKTGVQYGWGVNFQGRDANADLTQVYLNGVPSSVTVYNTPLQSRAAMKADLGIYAQDAWTMKRLTLNYGLRYEYFNVYVEAQDSPAGRFVPARHFDAIRPPTFKDFTPRLGAAYDLFGDGKTAVKGSISKYVSQQTTDFANNYN